MFEINDDFLKDIGIFTMPEPARGTLVGNIEKMIQNKINIRLAEDLSDEKVDEIERISTSLDDAKWWLGENLPRYEGTKEYELFKQQVTDGDPIMLFAQTKWLQMNVPNFAIVLQETMDETREELKTIGNPAPAQ